MKHRVFALCLACLAQAAVLVPTALAQGLRATPQLGASRPAPVTDNRARQADFIVAIVNSEPVTNNEVRARMFRVEQQMTQQGQALPPRDELARQILERLISEKAQLQIARENGMRIEDSYVDRAEQNVAAQYQVDTAALRRRLVADGTSVEQFREDLRDQLLLARMREREIEGRVKVSDLEVDQYVREQQGNNDVANLEVNLGHILVAVPESANEAQVAALQARAQRAQQRAVAGEDFTVLAREFSQAGGPAALGLRPLDRYPPLFADATAGLREGAVSPVLRSGAGFHVLKVLERRQAGMPGINVTQSRVRHILLRPGAKLTERAAIQQLGEMRKRIQAGQADFAALAKEFSEDASARNGGDLGWANPGVYVPEFEEVFNALAPGEIAEPLVSRFGVHLVQLLERRQTTLSAREQRELIRNIVREKKMDEAYAQWIQEIRGRAYVEYREPPQ